MIILSDFDHDSNRYRTLLLFDAIVILFYCLVYSCVTVLGVAVCILVVELRSSLCLLPWIVLVGFVLISRHLPKCLPPGNGQGDHVSGPFQKVEALSNR